MFLAIGQDRGIPDYTSQRALNRIGAGNRRCCRVRDSRRRKAAGLIDLNLNGRVAGPSAVIGGQRGERLNLFQAAAVHFEDADRRRALEIDVQKSAVRMELQAPRPGAVLQIKISGVAWCHHSPVRIEAIAVNAIQTQVRHIGEAFILAKEGHSVSTYPDRVVRGRPPASRADRCRTLRPAGRRFDRRAETVSSGR